MEWDINRCIAVRQAESKAEGKAEGKIETLIQNVKALLASNMTLEKIIEILKISNTDMQIIKPLL
jgi:predicted transposase YdaD